MGQIVVNVGGVYYETTHETLKKQPNAFFDDVQSEYLFVDRDGWIFQYILNYMRTGVILYPDEPYMHKLLELELAYFGFRDRYIVSNSELSQRAFRPT